VERSTKHETSQTIDVGTAQLSVDNPGAMNEKKRRILTM
jgi:hypothetical protein